MSTVSMMAVSSDIPFESEEEIAVRLTHYEKQFSNRYTEEDDWYAGTCQRTGRWHQVPVMSPWPPRGGFPKRKRRGGYPERRGRDRGDRMGQHEGHPYGRSSGSERYSRSPRHGYYGSGHQGRSPHHSPLSSGWGEQEHHRHPPLSPSSHDHTLHPPPPDHTLYPEEEFPYAAYHEQQSLRVHVGSRSPGSYPRQPGSSSIGHSDNSEGQQQWELHMSPGYDANKQMMEQHQHEGTKGDDDTTTASSQSSVGRDSSLGHELEATSTKVKGVAPPPLDLGIGEGEEHVVPSQSDVMDILSVASKGANDVTAENLKQVQRETQIQAVRKTMKSRQKQQHAKATLDKSSTKTATLTQPKVHKGRQKETVLVTHGHTKNVSHSRLLEGGKPISKTHALLQESIVEAAKEPSTAPSTSTVQRSKTAAILSNEGIGDPIHTKPKKMGGKQVSTRMKQKRRKVGRLRTELYSSSENEELDVVTPDSDTTSLSISLRRDFKSESSQIPFYTNEQKRREIRGNVRLSSEDLASDNSDEATDIAQSTEPSSLCVKINRNLIPKSLSVEDNVYKPVSHREQIEDPEQCDSSHRSPGYALEYNPSNSTKMVIRTNPLPHSEVEGQEVVGVPSVSKGKKRKKKHKHKKVMISDESDLKLKISLN